LQILADGSVLAEGDAPEGAEYRLRIDTDLARITALRLEALPHETLPGKGPGRGLGGAFSLAEFRATVAPRNGTGTPAAIQWQGVLAGGDRGAERTIDGQAATSWTVRRRGESVALTFLPRQPIGGDGGSTLEIALVQRETLGCFRLSATTAAAPAELRPPDQPAGQPATELLVRYVNLGGDGFQDEAGNLWVKSQDYDGTTFGHESGSSAGKGSQVYPGKPWAESAIRGLIAFRAVVPNGTYEVGLYFCEQWTKNADSRRYYAVFERDTPQQILRRFHAPGLTGPYLYTEPRVVVKDGILDLDFRTADPDSRVVLNGIHIRQLPVKAGPGGR
jgi:hypothetical protein